jgi:hypothetical protein
MHKAYYDKISFNLLSFGPFLWLSLSFLDFLAKFLQNLCCVINTWKFNTSQTVLQQDCLSETKFHIIVLFSTPNFGREE